VEERGQIVRRALAEAWGSAVERWGAEPAAWSYGELHTLSLHHPVGVVPAVGRLFNRGPFPVPGSATTVAAFGARWADDGPGGAAVQRVRYGPSLRWVTDLTDPDATLAVLPAGQAGHPRDPHYDDQIPLYLGGELRPLPWSDAAIEAATVSRLELRPAAADPEPVSQ
jgi:penicillin amidase